MQKILLVEDDSRVYRALDALFEGDKLINCETVKDAKYTIIMNSIAPFDAIICEENIPGEKGHTLINWCIENAIESKLVMLTAVPTGNEFQEKIVDKDKVSFIPKPWDPEKLVSIINN